MIYRIRFYSPYLEMMSEITSSATSVHSSALILVLTVLLSSSQEINNTTRAVRVANNNLIFIAEKV